MQRENSGNLEGTMGLSLSLMILDEQELALDFLEQNFAAGDPYAIHMNRMDVYDPLRNNPRYQALLKKMNMWP